MTLLNNEKNCSSLDSVARSPNSVHVRDLRFIGSALGSAHMKEAAFFDSGGILSRSVEAVLCDLQRIPSLEWLSIKFDYNFESQDWIQYVNFFEVETFPSPERLPMLWSICQTWKKSSFLFGVGREDQAKPSEMLTVMPMSCPMAVIAIVGLSCPKCFHSYKDQLGPRWGSRVFVVASRTGISSGKTMKYYKSCTRHCKISRS